MVLSALDMMWSCFPLCYILQLFLFHKTFVWCLCVLINSWWTYGWLVLVIQLVNGEIEYKSKNGLRTMEWRAGYWIRITKIRVTSIYCDLYILRMINMIEVSLACLFSPCLKAELRESPSHWIFLCLWHHLVASMSHY